MCQGIIPSSKAPSLWGSNKFTVVQFYQEQGKVESVKWAEDVPKPRLEITRKHLSHPKGVRTAKLSMENNWMHLREVETRFFFWEEIKIGIMLTGKAKMGLWGQWPFITVLSFNFPATGQGKGQTWGDNPNIPLNLESQISILQSLILSFHIVCILHLLIIVLSAILVSSMMT